jgi:hypothetical protein
MVDRAGFEFILPIARWKGFGGEMDVRTLCFETFTFAAALGAMTEQITIFSTVHVPVVHPVFAAKALVTVDHADSAAVDYHMNMARRNGQVDTTQIFNERQRYVAGLGSHPLIGCPERIAEELVRLKAAGIGGVTLSFVNFKDELPFFIARVLPLLRQAGLRRWGVVREWVTVFSIKSWPFCLVLARNRTAAGLIADIRREFTPTQVCRCKQGHGQRIAIKDYRAPRCAGHVLRARARRLLQRCHGRVGVLCRSRAL